MYSCLTVNRGKIVLSDIAHKQKRTTAFNLLLIRKNYSVGDNLSMEIELKEILSILREFYFKKFLFTRTLVLVKIYV